MTKKYYSSVKTDTTNHSYITKHSFTPHNAHRRNPNKSVIGSNKSVASTNKATVSANSQKSSTKVSSSSNKNQGFWCSLKGKLVKWSIISCIGTVAIYFWGHEDFHKVMEIPQHTDAFYVNDYSSSLLDSTERYIEDQGRKLYNQTSAQVVVTMVPDTGNKTLESYSLEMANTWQIGTKDKDNGVLLLFTTEEVPPHVRLEIGKGLEGDIPDGKAGRILDVYAVPYKKDGKFDEAALKTYAALLSILYQKYQLPIPDALSKEAIDNQVNNINKELEQQAQNKEVQKQNALKQNALNQTNGSENNNNQDIAPENKSPMSNMSKTFADADFPEMKLVPNDNSLITELCGSFVVFLFLYGFWTIIANFIKSLFGFGDSEDGYTGTSTSSSRTYSSRSYSSSSGSSSSSSSSSGHGGSFGGGGASR